MTGAQRRALDTLWERYGLDSETGVLDLDALFGRRAPRCLEIGFGMGEALAALAQTHPERDYLGIEVHRPGVGALLARLESLKLTHVRLFCADAVDVVNHRLPAACLDAVYVFFPDPWPKKRHHKRRLVQPEFIELLAEKLRPGGVLHMATDWEDYARHMMEVMERCALFINTAGPGNFAPRGERPPTRFENRGRRLGHRVWDLVFERRGTSAPG